MNSQLKGSGPVKILWTGGWDSTFQLLELLLVQKSEVIPYYLIEEERRSTRLELLTMKKIKAMVRAYDPQTEKLLAPTRIYALGDIPPNPKVTEAFERIKAGQFMGRQYDWLARFCEWQNLSDLQLGIHKDDKAHAVLEGMLTAKPGNEGEFIVDEKFLDSDEYTIFGRFSFPILNLTKLDMNRLARERGWQEIMLQTWFCHRPVKDKPCGRCNPCRYTVEEGMGFRIPRMRVLMGKFRKGFLKPLKKSLLVSSKLM
jgi:hypothetical protein